MKPSPLSDVPEASGVEPSQIAKVQGRELTLKYPVTGTEPLLGQSL
ncbi:hypothetical protein VCHENC02_3526 [Vibrio harveyi]|uniref:Uncharacterized protein n=1 Tax=Vibrio harveyi TaxID=669 RepID=A0A454CWK2_VIBHA|nr:hypothetical protein VCHENC02_3526 [Vibrio harveyi]